MQEAETSRTGERTTFYLPIEDYAVIGDLHTVALVGKNGSIDWCCLPRFDSPSVFGALLDAQKGSFFRLSPTTMDGVACKQLYLPGSNLLLTRFLTDGGVGEVTDFMPFKQVGTAEHEHQIIRSVAMVHGSLSFTLVCRPAFNYARDTHSFVQYYGSDAVDASALLLLITNFTGTKEPRMLSTIDRIQKELTSGALVRRYNPKKAANDGFTCQEGTFGACSFWLIEDLARPVGWTRSACSWRNCSPTATTSVSMLRRSARQARHSGTSPRPLPISR